MLCIGQHVTHQNGKSGIVTKNQYKAGRGEMVLVRWNGEKISRSILVKNLMPRG